MRRSLLRVFVLCALASLLVAAQAATGVLRGITRDSSGGVLAGVTVVITQTSSTFTRTTISNPQGRFEFVDLPLGQYTVTLSRAGFASLTRTATVSRTSGVDLEITLLPAPREEAAKDTATPPPPRTGGGTGGGVYGGVSGGIVGGLETAPAGAVQQGQRGDPRTRAMAAPAIGSRIFNTEAYDKIDDNQWVLVANRPLSTFSTDVDTASYANIRRYLNQGQLPPKDAVRIEEMINYFSYDYREPVRDAPFTVTTALGECPWNSTHQLALIGVQTRRVDRTSTPPRNLVFLVDVSGSMMSPAKLPLVKASLALLAKNLTAADRIALVVYAGAAGTVLPSTSGGDPSAILDALARLEAGGSTNGARGIQLAYDLAEDHFIAGGVNRVVLATDGDFNVGVTSQGDLVRLVEQYRERGITLSVLGFGMGNLKDSTMEKLADRGNGNYSYIDSLSEAQKVLVEEAGGTLVTAAKDVKLQVEFNPNVVGAYRLVGYENRLLQDQDFNDDKKDAGDMGAGHSVTALYELVPAGQTLDIPGVDPLKYQQPARQTSAADRAEAMTVKLRYKKPDGDISALVTTVVPARPRMTPALGFASAVAEFGLLLRDSEFKGSASYVHARTLARTHRGEDPFGHRAEFARLVDIAENLSRSARSRN